MSLEVGENCLDGLTDLNEPDADGIEDQAIGGPAPGDKALDGLEDVLQSLAVASAHKATASAKASSRTRGLRLLTGARSTLTFKTRSNVPSRARTANRLVFSGRSTRRSTSLSGRSSPRATLPNTRRLVAPSVGQTAHRRVAAFQAQLQLMTCRGDEPRQGGHRRLPLAGLILAHDALRHPGPRCELGLRQARTPSRLALQLTGRIPTGCRAGTRWEDQGRVRCSYAGAARRRAQLPRAGSTKPAIQARAR